MKKEKTEKLYTPGDDGSLAHLFFQTARKLRMKGGPAYSQQKVLGILEDIGPLSQKTVQEMLDIKPGSLSELCAKMEDKGLVERCRDENDKRSVIVKITEKGREQRKAIEASKDDIMFAALNEEERAKLRELLLKLNADAGGDLITQLYERREQGK